MASISRLMREGEPVLKHPKAALALVTDGSFTEGQAPQVPPADEEHRQILIGHRSDRDGIRFITYADNGNFSKSVFGYKLVALVCVATGRCVISTLVPGDTYEPDAAIYLLERLFELWPECPVQYLVGDALYGNSKGFGRELLFRFGIDPVFPWRADFQEDETQTRHGVPLCHCLDEPRPMVFKQRKGKWWGPAQRLAGGLRRGQLVPVADRGLRYEYKCPDGICRNKVTRPWKHPGIYTFLPHTGDGKHASLRRILLRQRNVVESHYSALQKLTKQGNGVERPQWANDVEVHWVLSLASTFLTARRLVIENGLYQKALDEANELHLMQSPGRSNPAPGPSSQELADATRRRFAAVGSPEPPESWDRFCAGQVEPLSGSAERWALEWQPQQYLRLVA